MLFFKKAEKEKAIALDFDGVLHSYTSGWTGEIPTDSPVSGSVDFVNNLISLGYKLYIFSCRAKYKLGVSGIKDWLNKYGFPESKITVTNEKPEADIYIDDRGFRFEGNFEEALKFVKENKKSWFK